MRRLLAQRRVPELPVLEPLPTIAKFGDIVMLRTALESQRVRISTWYRRLLEFVDQMTRDTFEQLNTQVQGLGPAIESDVTIQVTHPIHVVTGSASIDTIEPPLEARGVEADQTTPRLVTSFTGPVWLLADVGSTWSLTTGGNIKAAATPTAGHHLTVVYDGEFWWPS